MNVDIIDRQDAIEFLRKRRMVSRGEIWDGEKWVKSPKRRLPAHPRGPGASVDYINYGIRNSNGKIVAVARIGPAPYGNNPAKAALGEDLAPHAAYLMRQYAIGVTKQELLDFVRGYVDRLNSDMVDRGHDIRYLLSLDDPQAKLIEREGVRRNALAVTGKVYVESGALYGGVTGSAQKATRYITEDGEIRSIYQNGKSVMAQVMDDGLPLIREGRKHRFVWVLNSGNSLVNAAWARSLPASIRPPRWGEDLGWVQPRMLFPLRGKRKPI